VINQLYAVGRSLINIDSDSLTICQVANVSNEVISVYKKMRIAVVSLHLTDKDCVFLTSGGTNIQTARVDINPHEHHTSNHDLPTQMTSDCLNKAHPHLPRPPTVQTCFLSLLRLCLLLHLPPLFLTPLPTPPPPPPHIPRWRPPPFPPDL